MALEELSVPFTWHGGEKESIGIWLIRDEEPGGKDQRSVEFVAISYRSAALLSKTKWLLRYLWENERFEFASKSDGTDVNPEAVGDNK